jgi:predicted RNase H-like HicB family nuclease/predicted HTH domain antitoxin
LPEYIVSLKIEKLDEGVYLATSETLQGLVAQGRTIAETMEIAQDLARKLIESYIEHGDPLPVNMTTEANVLKEGMEGLIRGGHYKDREALLEGAFRTLLEVKPSIRTEMAIELYKSEKISLSRAAEIAGTSFEGFKNILEIKGIVRVVAAPTAEKIQRGVDFILG